MHTKLLNFIGDKISLADKDIVLCKQYFEPVLYPKNRVIEEEAHIPRYMYYIVSGYLRLFNYNENGDEITTHINCPPGFFTSYTNFISQQKSAENVECVTDCQLLRISKANFDKLMDESEAIRDFSVSVFHQAIAYNETRSAELATLTAEQRYRKLIAKHPDILHNVPIIYISSFLGMKPESLSRIRKKIATG